MQRLDVYRPAGAKDAPIIVMVHGGGWQRGDKAASAVVDNKVAHYLPEGYVFVSLNYRLLPAVDSVTQARDVAKALAYTQRHARAWGGNAHHVVRMGHSAPKPRLSGHSAPMLLACSTGRRTSCREAHAFAARAAGLGTRSQVTPVHSRHGEINHELGTPCALTRVVGRFLHTLRLP